MSEDPLRAEEWQHTIRIESTAQAEGLRVAFLAANGVLLELLLLSFVPILLITIAIYGCYHC